MLSIQRRALLIGKILYFLQFGALGIFIPFVNVYYRNIGLSGTQIGLLITVGSLIGIFATPMWGLLCDRFGRIQTILAIATVGSVIFILAISFTQAFLGILLLSVLFNFFASAVNPLIDNYTLTLLKTEIHRYGSQRVWGTAGFLASTLIAGPFLDRVGLRGLFWGYAFLIGLMIPTLIFMPSTPARLGQAVMRGFGKMIRQPAWIIMGICIILVMISNISWLNFLSVAMKSIGASDTLVGRAWSVGTITEIIVMLFGPRLVRKFGARRLVVIGFAFYGLRLVLYSIMPRPEWVLGINLLHGFSFGFYWIGAVNYVSELAPDDLRATSQGMLSTFFNVASVSGGPLIGFLFDSVGPFLMFRVAAAFSLTAVLLFTLGNLWIARRRSIALSLPG